MINSIEVLINSLLRDFLLRGSNTEIRIRRNVAGATTFTLQGQRAIAAVNATITTGMCANNKLCPDVERLVYGRLASRQRFVLILHVLAETHDLWLNRNSCTYRELLYKNIFMPCNMVQITKAVQDVSCLLGQPSWNLGIFGSGKGLIAGPLLIYMSTGDVIDCSCLNTPTLIPPNFTFVDHFETSAHLILVVEKDTVFKRLLQNGLFSAMEGQVILVTARGFPDISTRWILNKLMRQHHFSMYILTDGDPFGIEIMLTYRHGSLKYSRHSSELACPQLKWLGIHPSDITNMRLPQEPLSPTDYRKINSILLRTYIEDEIRRELIVLQHHQHKVKLDNMPVFTFAAFINDYIINKIKRQVVI